MNLLRQPVIIFRICPDSVALALIAENHAHKSMPFVLFRTLCAYSFRNDIVWMSGKRRPFRRHHFHSIFSNCVISPVKAIKIGAPFLQPSGLNLLISCDILIFGCGSWQANSYRKYSLPCLTPG